MTTIEQLAGITSQHSEIVKRVGNGSLDPASVKRALQDIIEGKFTTPALNPPSWWRTPKQQLKRARQLWPYVALPEPPAEFTPRTKSEVLLLHVPDTFDSFLCKVVAPSGYTKYRWTGIKDDRWTLRLAPNKREFTEPIWLAFDPEHGRDEDVYSLWFQADLAASEVFSALIQFPEWPLAWFNGASAPYLMGYHPSRDGHMSRVLYLHRRDRKRRLMLKSHLVSFSRGGRSPDTLNDGWSSPSVRKC